MSSCTSIDLRSGSGRWLIPEAPTMIHRRGLMKRGAIVGAAGFVSSLARAWALDGGGPVEPARIHAEPKAKNLLLVFLTGGMSHVDTFDFKPKLQADSGRVVPSVDLR